MIRLNFHPAANIFPLFDDSRLAELADDIKAFGQREPIKLAELTYSALARTAPAAGITSLVRA